jgi:hypothetical protein
MEYEELFTELLVSAVISSKNKSRIILPNHWNVEFLLFEELDFGLMAWGPVALDPESGLPVSGVMVLGSKPHDGFNLLKRTAYEFLKVVLEKPLIEQFHLRG